MLFRLRYAVLVLFCALISWLGWGVYGYLFDAAAPHIKLIGLENNCCYAGDIACHVASNKMCEVSVFIDDQQLINNAKLNSRDLEYSFVVPTKSIVNGDHIVRVDAVDTSFRKNKTIVKKSFTVDNVPLKVSFVKADTDYRVFQGRTLHIQFKVNKEIKSAYVNALANKYVCFPESKHSSIYECFIPIACEEAPNEYHFSIEVVDNVGNVSQVDNKFHVMLYPFKKQTLHVDADKVEEEKQLGLAMNELENALQILARKSPQEKLWKGEFCTPIDIVRTTCDFGTIRTTQEKGRYMHKALDVINAPKSVVWATQDGVVVLKDRYEHSGNTVVIDHGYGVLSLFFHLDEFANIEVGQKVAKGNKIGTLGQTGYAKGYHLHWEMRVNNVAVDPLEWTKSTF